MISPLAAPRLAPRLLVCVLLAAMLGPAAALLGSRPPAPTPPAAKVSAPLVPILMYHYIRVNPNPRDSLGAGLSVTPGAFDAQMAYLESRGVHPVDMQDVLNAIAGGAPLPSRPVVLTFDDGYVDFFGQAAPIMLRHGLHGTTYLVPGFVNQPGYMTTPMVQQVDRWGMTIAAHTVHHLDLARQSASVANYEIAASRGMLQQMTGEPVTDFAYPYGGYTAAVEQMVLNAGFHDAVTTDGGNAPMLGINGYSIHRIRIAGGDSLATFISKVGITGPPIGDNCLPGVAPPQGSNGGFVAAAYHDLIGTDPDRNANETATAALQFGFARQRFICSLLTSDSYTDRRVRTVYQTLLGRSPDDGGLAGWSDALGAGLPDEVVLAQLAGSDEYFATRAHGDPAQWVGAIFGDFLGRSPGPGEAVPWVNALSQLSRSTVAYGILHTPERESRVVTVDYAHLLQRNVDPSGLASFTAFLVAGHSAQDLTVVLMSSAEYFQRAGIPPCPRFGIWIGGPGQGTAAYIGAAYSDVLGRLVDPGGLDNFSRLMAQGLSPAGFVCALLRSDEYRVQVISPSYTNLLGRAPDPGGAAAFSRAMAQGIRDEDVSVAIASSDEYFAGHGHGNNVQFVAALYSDILDRPEDPSGAANFLAFLNSGGTRASVTYALLASDEYRLRIIGADFIRLLHRPATSDERTSDLSHMQNGVSDEDIVLSIVVGTEYAQLHPAI